MNRREALKRASVLAAGTASMPMLAGWLSGCGPTPAAAWSPTTLSSVQNELAIAMVETIIPQTDTPGAEAAQVNQFIDILTTEVFPPRVRQFFLDSLDGITERVQTEYSTTYDRLTDVQQAEFMQKLVNESDEEEGKGLTYYSIGGFPPGPDEPPPFFALLKRATLIGYYTSEIGATQELRYEGVPGRYDGNVDYPSETVNRTWSV